MSSPGRIPISELPKLLKRGPRIRGVAPKPERTRDGRLFGSKGEAEYYVGLKIRKVMGELRPPYFLCQVPFHLPGGVIFRLDFMVFPIAGHIVFAEVKGHRTEVYKIKKRQVEELYVITITEIEV